METPDRRQDKPRAGKTWEASPFKRKTSSRQAHKTMIRPPQDNCTTIKRQAQDKDETRTRQAQDYHDVPSDGSFVLFLVGFCHDIVLIGYYHDVRTRPLDYTKSCEIISSRPWAVTLALTLTPNPNPNNPKPDPWSLIPDPWSLGLTLAQALALTNPNPNPKPNPEP